MDLTISREKQALVDKAKEIAASIREDSFEYDEKAEFPVKNFDKLGEAGLLKLSVPEELGGHGLWRVDKAPLTDRFVPYYQIIAALAAGDASTAQLTQIQTHATGIVAGQGSQEQKERLLGEVVTRGALMSSVGSEVDPHSTFTGVRNELRPVPGGFRYSGTKWMGSLAAVADYNLMYLKAPGIDHVGRGLAVVIIPKEDVTLENDWDVLGMRATVSWKVTLDDVFIPWENVIGEPGAWNLRDPRSFGGANVANHLGTAQGAYDFVLGTLKQRPFLMDDDVNAFAMGDMESWLQAGFASMNYAAWLWEQGDFVAAEHATQRALHTAKSIALNITNKAIEVVGTRGVFRHLPLERALRDVRTFTLHGRDSHAMRAIAEGTLTGEYQAKASWGGPRIEPVTWEQIGLKRPLVTA